MQKEHLFAGLALGCLALFALAFSPAGARHWERADKESLMPVDPKERLEAERLERSMFGLKEQGNVLVAAVGGHDRGLAVRLTGEADRLMKTENSWFESIGRFRDAVLADVSYAPAYEGLNRALQMEGHLHLAELALNTALSIDPKYAQARYELGELDQFKGEYAGAVAQWKSVVESDPAYPDVYARMAVASYHAQDYSSAWRYLDEAERRNQAIPAQFKPLLKEVAPRP